MRLVVCAIVRGVFGCVYMAVRDRVAARLCVRMAVCGCAVCGGCAYVIVRGCGAIVGAHWVCCLHQVTLAAMRPLIAVP